jgi:hypothetical protein
MRRHEPVGVTGLAPAKTKFSNQAGFGPADGETRTRTGDTTIFRQMLRTLDQPRKHLQIRLVLKRATSVAVSRN